MLALIPGEHPLLARRVNYYQSSYFEGFFDPHPNHLPPSTLAELAARPRVVPRLAQPSFPWHRRPIQGHLAADQLPLRPRSLRWHRVVRDRALQPLERDAKAGFARNPGAGTAGSGTSGITANDTEQRAKSFKTAEPLPLEHLRSL